MTELTDERVKEIAKSVAHDNNVDLSDVKTSRTVDSTGASAIEVSSLCLLRDRPARWWACPQH
jgi:hypothetical protein